MENKTAGHTPGPWIIRYNAPSIQVQGKREGFESLTVEKVGGGLRSIIADIDNWKLCDEHGDILSNARLIAAAPELLAAAMSIVETWDGPREYAALRFAQNILTAKAAIAKAEGR